jgi:hypothetical protein
MVNFKSGNAVRNGWKSSRIASRPRSGSGYLRVTHDRFWRIERRERVGIMLVDRVDLIRELVLRHGISF